MKDNTTLGCYHLLDMSSLLASHFNNFDGLQGYVKQTLPDQSTTSANRNFLDNSFWVASHMPLSLN